METSEQSLKGYLILIASRKYAFILTVVSVITIFLLSSYIMPKMYEAKCSVLVETNVIEKLVKDIAVTPSLEERLRVLDYSMKSRNLLLSVMQDLGYNVSEMDPSEIEKLIRKFEKNTQISNTKKMDMFVVSFRGRDPVFTRDYVNTLVRRYIEMNIAEKREETLGANRFLSEQIKFFKGKLDEAESEIVHFRKDRGIFVAIDERKVVDEIKIAQEKVGELKLSKDELLARKGMIKKQMEQEDPYTVSILGMKTGDTAQGRYLMLQARLNELTNKYTENHPEVIRLKAEMESLEMLLNEGVTEGGGSEKQNPETEMSTLNPLYQQLKEELAKVELELAALIAKEDHLNKLIETKKAYLRDIPGEKKNLLDLERERETYEKIYTELVNRLGQSEVSKQMEFQDKAATFRVVDPAIVPAEPVSPNRLRLLFLGIIAGFAGGFGMVMFLDYRDDSIKTVDVLKSLGLPVLAIIPSMQTLERQMKRKRRDVLIYSLTGIYVMCILGVMAAEILG